MMFYWLMVFEQIVWLASPKDGTLHPANFKWTRTGEVEIRPGDATGAVIEDIAKRCKTNDQEIPNDAVVVDVSLIPAVLVPMTSS